MYNVSVVLYIRLLWRHYIYQPLYIHSCDECFMHNNVFIPSQETTDTETPFSPDTHSSLSSVLKVVTPGNKLVPVVLCEDMTIEDVLHTCCKVGSEKSRILQYSSNIKIAKWTITAFFINMVANYNSHVALSACVANCSYTSPFLPAAATG